MLSRRLLLPLVLLTLALSAGLGAMFTRPPVDDWASAPPAIQALLWPQARVPAVLNLQSVDGESITFDQPDGSWRLLYFGYLSCPDICPTTLQALRSMRTLERERNSSSELQLYFVSIDPDNDSVERINRYLEYFGNDIIGVRAEEPQLQQFSQSLGVMYSEFVDSQGVRSVDHTSSIIIIDPRGRAVGALPPPHEPAMMLQQLDLLRGYVTERS